MSYTITKRIALSSIALLTFSTMVVSAQNRRPEKKENSSISILDSTEAQWGRRSINDSIYRGYTVNAVYAERGRQRLPDSFNMYKPTAVDETTIVNSSPAQDVTTIRVNGKEQKLPTE